MVANCNLPALIPAKGRFKWSKSLQHAVLCWLELCSNVCGRCDAFVKGDNRVTELGNWNVLFFFLSPKAFIPSLFSFSANYG